MAKEETKLTIYQKLVKIQSELKVPRNRYNKFSNFYYRSAEDILEALKPLLKENELSLLLQDEIVLVGSRYYLKALVQLTNGKDFIATEGYAREEETIKGMSGSQISGSSSSYARKYALNGMFLIDDSEDADTRDNNEKPEAKKPEVTKKEAEEVVEKLKKGDDVLASRLRIKIKNTVFMEDLQQLKQEIADAGKVLNKEQFESVIAEAKKKKEQLQGVEISDEELNNLDFSK